MIPACPLSPPTYKHSLSTGSWITSGSAVGIDIAVRNGDIAYDRGDATGALAKYREAAAGFLMQPQWGGIALDDELHLARVLALMHDRPTAQMLWRLYLRDTQAPASATQAQRLRAGNFARFFADMQSDRGYYTENHPADGDAEKAIAQGAAAGARGDLAAAQHDFDEAAESAVYSSSYAIYAWGTAAWARGDRANARLAWLCASDAGHDPIGDMPFNSAGNRAAVTMLLALSSR